jgi:hypothetical protein
MKYLYFALGAIMLFGCAVTPKVIEETINSDAEYQKVQKEMCERVMCQYDVRVTLKKKDGSLYDRTFDSMPVVQDEGVMVLAGHSVFFEADIKDNQLKNLKLVDTIVNPEKTVTAKFEQMDDGQMMLSLHNPFNKHLRVKMGIMPLDSEDLYPTSSCPVIASGGSYEMWPYPIFQVWLGTPRLLGEKENMNCVE